MSLIFTVPKFSPKIFGAPHHFLFGKLPGGCRQIEGVGEERSVNIYGSIQVQERWCGIVCLRQRDSAAAIGGVRGGWGRAIGLVRAGVAVGSVNIYASLTVNIYA